MKEHKDARSLTTVRDLPPLHEVLGWPAVERLCADVPRWLVKEAARDVLAQERAAILKGRVHEVAPQREIEQRIQEKVRLMMLPRLRKVVNATGVVLHTGLGRAPLSEEAIEAVISVATGYCNLEIDLETGKRGHRFTHVDELLCGLTGAEASLVVNNNAAAVFLGVLSLAKDKEVIVSRGELVEIGGSFRIPDIIKETGARIVEIGTTNRTTVKDYERAITSHTGLILKVHPSNFRIVGFSSEATPRELVDLAKRFSLPFMYDLGSGCLCSLQGVGSPSEPLVKDVVNEGVDLVTFSGDKLLGGPQAGIMVGKKGILDPIRRHPLHRVLRVDKMTLAALEATLGLYRDSRAIDERVPVMRLFTTPSATLKKRAQRLKKLLYTLQPKPYDASTVQVVSRAGGGSLPAEDLPGVGVKVWFHKLSPEQALAFFRSFQPPIIARIEHGAVVFDMGTVLPGEEKTIYKAFEALVDRSEVEG